MIDRERREYLDAAVDAYLRAVQHSLSEFDEDIANASFEPPAPVLDELRSVASRIVELQTYLNRLIVYARLFAAEPSIARTVARATGISHSTIGRMATPELVADVAGQAQPVARARMEDLRPATNPHFYRRLAAIASPETVEA